MSFAVKKKKKITKPIIFDVVKSGIETGIENSTYEYKPKVDD